ncbi:MAG: acetate/propionate family kinase [Pseudomonadota bacterium]
MTGAALILNAGSSSIKFALFPEADGDAPMLTGAVERIAGDAMLHVSPKGAERQSTPIDAPDHAASLRAIAGALGDQHITAVGHRIVHGGPDFTAPVEIDDAVLDALQAIVHLAPLHLPQALDGIRATRRLYPVARQVAAFDTAFHAEKPWLHDSFALPTAMYDEGVRRYGFHGISCQSILRGLHAEGLAIDTTKIVIAHLGNGCSMTAVRGGRCHATSMGFSTLDGLVMGTRSGRIDPGVLLHWLRAGKSGDEIEQILYHRSGLLGLSGLSNDMRDLEASDDPNAQRAIDSFVARAVEEACRLAGTMGGLDMVVFCGGIGENADMLRDRIMDGLAFLPGADGSGPKALVRATREEHEILCAVRATTLHVR